MLTGTTAVAPPGFWFTPSVNMSLKSPMSAELLHLQKSNSPSLDTISHLQTLAQTRYPLVSSLHSPFAPFPSSSIPSFYQTPANIEALKKFGLTNPGYVNSIDQLNANTMKADEKCKNSLPVNKKTLNNCLMTKDSIYFLEIFIQYKKTLLN